MRRVPASQTERPKRKTLPVPDEIWRILLDPETAKRPPGWAARFYERRPDLRHRPFDWPVAEAREGPAG